MHGIHDCRYTVHGEFVWLFSFMQLVTQQQQQRPFNGLWSGTTRVGRYQKKHSPTHTHPDQRASFIVFLHLQRSMASSLFNLRAWQSSRTTSFQVFFGLPLGLDALVQYACVLLHLEKTDVGLFCGCLNITQIILTLSSLLWHCWLGVRNSIPRVKIKWWGVDVVICQERDTDCLHVVQLMLLHPILPSSLASFKSRLFLPFWYQLTQVVLEKMGVVLAVSYFTLVHWVTLLFR